MRTCKNCGELGHNRRTCTNPTVAPATPTTSSGRVCGNCGETGHNARTCVASATSPVATPTPKKETVIVDPQGIVTPPNVSQPTVKDTIYGVDVSGMKVINKDTGFRIVKQYLTKKNTYIFFPEINITRQEQFENTLDKIAEIVKSRNNDKDLGLKLVFKYDIVNREKQKVPDSLVRYAERDLLPGSFKEKGVWYWEIITYMVEHSEFEDPKFELIGAIVNLGGWDKNKQTWEFTTKFFPRNDALAFGEGGNYKRAAQYKPIDASIDTIVAPQYEKMKAIFKIRSDRYGNTAEHLKNGQADDAPKRYMGNCLCTKCNPNGDNVWRRAVYVYMATEDIKGFKVGRVGSDNLDPIDIKQYQIITLGDGCEYIANPVDIELVASLYDSSRVKSVHQYQWHSPFSRFGYGYKEMDMRSYLKRVFAFYGKKMEAVIKTLEEKGVKFFQIPDSFILKDGITYRACNPYALDYLLDKMQNASYGSERRRYDKELRSNQKQIYESIFPQPYQRGKNKGKKPPASGIFNDKSSFLLRARMFEHDGKYWLQSGDPNAKNGVQKFLETYENEYKNDPEWFITELQPIFNEDGLPLIDENGEPEEEFITLPNPEKLRELYAKDGGIFEIWNPDDVEDEVLDAIEYIESLDAKKLPDILRKYFESYQVLNPQSQLRDLNAVGSAKNSREDALRIWQIWTISQLEERRQKSYYTYISEQKEKMERRMGISLQRIPFRMLDAQQKEVIEYITNNSWEIRNANANGIVSDDDYNYIQNLKWVNELVVEKQGEEKVLYVEDGKPIDYTLLENVKNAIETLEEETRKLRKVGGDFRDEIVRAYRQNEGEYINVYGLSNRRSNIPSMGEIYTNKEILDVLEIDSSMLPSADKIGQMLYLINLESAITVDSNGLITKFPMGYYMTNKLKRYFEQKQLANIGVGQAPVVAPVAPIPKTTSTMPFFTKTEMLQLERDVEVAGKGYIPENTTTELKGYIFNIFDKSYNAPAWASGLKNHGRVKYVTMITAGNDDPNLDYHFVNFPYSVSELDRYGDTYSTGTPIAISDYTMKDQAPFRNRKQRNCYVRYGGLRKER